MKKISSLAVVLLSLFSLAACGGSKSEPAMKVENDSFSLTPQEYIDYVNNLIEIQDDSSFLTIPDFTESGKTIYIESTHLSLKLTANDGGKLTEIQWHWNAKKQDTTSNIGFYLGVSVLMVSANEDAQGEIVDGLNMFDTTPPEYDTSYTLDGVLYSYSTYGHGQYNTITITPTSDS